MIKSLGFKQILIILFTTIATIYFCFLVLNNNFVFGSYAGGWTYHYYENISWRPESFIIPLFLSIGHLSLIYFSIQFLSRKNSLASEWIVISYWLIYGFLSQLFLYSLNPYSLQYTITNATANEYWHAATQITPSSLLKNYFQSTEPFNHVKANLPGKVLFYHLLLAITKSTKGLGLLIVFFSISGLIPIYFMIRTLFNRTSAILAIAFFTLVPSKVECLPILNTISPLWGIIDLFLFIHYLHFRKWPILILLGVMIYLTFIFEPLPMTMGLIGIGLLINFFIKRSITTTQLFTIFSLSLLGFVTTFLVFKLLFHFDLYSAFRHILEINSALISNQSRHYNIWVTRALVELGVSAGVPQAIIFSGLFFRCIYLKIKLVPWQTEDWLVFSVAAVLLFIDLAGVTCGENTRLWIFIATLFQLPVAVWLGQNIEKSECIAPAKKLWRQKFLSFNYLLLILLVVGVIFQTAITITKVGFVAP